jgi:hypothetical protein
MQARIRITEAAADARMQTPDARPVPEGLYRMQAPILHEIIHITNMPISCVFCL